MAKKLLDTVPPVDSFEVYESRGFKKRVPWEVNLTDTQAEFICHDDSKRTIVIPREKARAQIKFMQMGLMLSGGTLATVSGKANLEFGKYKRRFTDWLPPLSMEDVKDDLRNTGVGLIMIGVLSFFLSQIFDSIWGVILVGLGIVNLFVKNRTMYIVNGIVLIVVGIFNIIHVINSINAYWLLYGVVQIFWGIAEIKKYGQVKV